MISSDAKIRSLKIEDGKRHADRDGLVLEIRKSGKKVGVGLVAGVASYCFFKARSGANTTVESSSENIEDILRNHFAATIGMTILPQDRVEIIDDEQALSRLAVPLPKAELLS